MVDAEYRNELEPRAFEAKTDVSRFLPAGKEIVASGLASGANRIPLLAPYRKAEIHVVREGARGMS